MAQDIKPSNDDHRDRLFIGLVLVGIGVVLLLISLLQINTLVFFILPLIGLAFLAYAFYRREFGFGIPGCIMTALGFALLLAQSATDLDGLTLGGLFVMGLALAFVLMALISPYFERRLVWWPLIPGGIIGFVGLLLLLGDVGLGLLEVIGKLWPLLLVVVGAFMLIVPFLRKHS